MRYFASENADDPEIKRLRLLEATLDHATIARLERIGVAAGWSCLEVAAGGGSIAAWLGRRVQPGGSVLATDMNTRFLGHLEPPVRVDTCNLMTDDLGSEAFDLVHGRAILMHLPEPEMVLEKMVAALKPGGWICIEEGDYLSLSAEPTHPEAEQWTNDSHEAFRRLREAGVVDMYFGRRVRTLLEAAGIESVGADGVTDVRRGGETGARFIADSASVMHAAGLYTDEAYERSVRCMSDPSFVFVDKTIFGAWGVRKT